MNPPNRSRFFFLRTRAFWFGFAGWTILTAIWTHSLFISSTLGCRMPPPLQLGWEINSSRGCVSFGTFSGSSANIEPEVTSEWQKIFTPIWWPDQVWSDFCNDIALTLPLWPLIFLWLIGWLAWMNWQARRRRAHLIESTPPADD